MITAYIGVIDEDKIDIDHFKKLMKILNSTTDVGVFFCSKTYYKYYFSVSKYITFENVLDIIAEYGLQTQTIEVISSIQDIVIGHFYYVTIRYRIDHIEEIVEYQTQHSGEYPPISCYQKLITLLYTHCNPYQYDYIKRKNDDTIHLIHRLFSKKVVVMLHHSSVIPHLQLLKKEGSSYSMPSYLKPNSAHSSSPSGNSTSKCSRSRSTSCPEKVDIKSSM